MSRQRVALYIDPPSHHFLGDRLFSNEKARFVGDNLMEPHIYLRQYLSSLGVETHTIDFMPDHTTGGAEILKICVSLGRMEGVRQYSSRPDVIFSAYFAMECPIVEPSLYRALGKLQGKFKRVYSWSDSQSLERFTGRPLRCLPFRWPQSYEQVHQNIWEKAERRFLVMINANKLPRLKWQELVSMRLKAVAYFSELNEIDLYGSGWDGPPWRVGKTWVPYTVRIIHNQALVYWQRFRPDPLLSAARRVYHGRTTSKSETLGGYTYCLCFENMILKGWITEKIFDCFFAGTVPIYWGAPDVQDYIPEGCYIDMRKFSDFASLREYLHGLSPADILAYKHNARDFLASPAFKPFSKQTFADLFRSMIEEDSGLQLGESH